MLAYMSEKERERGVEQLVYICKDYCGKCPTSKGTGETSLVCCTLGKSAAINEKKGCLCGQCPLTRMMSFRREYYCTQGKAMEFSEAEHRWI